MSISASRGNYHREERVLDEIQMFGDGHALLIGGGATRLGLESGTYIHAQDIAKVADVIYCRSDLQLAKIQHYHLCESAPKSVSIHVLATLDEDKSALIRKQFIEAVKEVYEPKLNNTDIRKGADGKIRIEAQSSALIYGHGLSTFVGDDGKVRTNPHLHFHIDKSGIAITEDGRAGADGKMRGYFRDQGLHRIETHKRLEEIVNNLGIETVKSGWTFEIAGYPPELLKEMSRASAEINHGLTPAQRDVMARERQGRGQEVDKPREEIRAEWLERCKEYKIELKEFKRPTEREAQFKAAALVESSVGALAKEHLQVRPAFLFEKALSDSFGTGLTYEQVRNQTKLVLKHELHGITKAKSQDGTTVICLPAKSRPQEQIVVPTQQLETMLAAKPQKAPEVQLDAKKPKELEAFIKANIQKTKGYTHRAASSIVKGMNDEWGRGDLASMLKSGEKRFAQSTSEEKEKKQERVQPGTTVKVANSHSLSMKQYEQLKAIAQKRKVKLEFTAPAVELEKPKNPPKKEQEIER